MKVAVTDYTFDSLDTEEAVLAPLGHSVVGRRCKTPEELKELVADADAVLTQFAPVDAAVIAAMGRAKVIVRYGIGVDNVDLAAARARGIPVCNVPDYCTNEVADHTVALILALTRQIAVTSNHVHGGKWNLPVPLTAMHSLKALTVGVIGLGRIGREVVVRLWSFKCTLLAYDPAVPAEKISQFGCIAATLDRLLRTSDIVTLHCPSTPETVRMIDAAALAKMKPGALLVNVARGNLVDTAALVEALRSGRLGGAGLDVCDPEPIPADSPLLGMANVLVTPHVASASVPAVLALRTQAAQTAAMALRGERPPNIVNGVKA